MDAAIEFFFTSENVVATHTLAAAAYNALKDIAKQEGAPHPFIKTEYIPSLPEAERNRMFKQINEPENFFKHADRDPTDEILFNTDLTELLLVDACAYFHESHVKKPRYYDALKVWAGKTRDDVPDDSDLRILMDTFREVLKSKGKREFWAMFKQHISSRNIT